MRTTTSAGASVRRRTFVLLAAIAVALVGIVLVTQRPVSAHDHQLPNNAQDKGATFTVKPLFYLRTPSSYLPPPGSAESVMVIVTLFYSPDGPRVAP